MEIGHNNNDSEEYSLCTICSKNDSVGRNFTCSLEYLQNVYHRSNKLFDSDIFVSVTHLLKDLIQTDTIVPFCNMCFSTMEKLYEMHEHLDKVQKCIADLVSSLTNKMLRNRDINNTAESKRSKDDLNEMNSNTRCTEVITDWNTISNCVKQECLPFDSIKTEESSNSNLLLKEDIHSIIIEEFEFEDFDNPRTPGSLDLNLQPKNESILNCDNVCNFTTTNGCDKTVVLKPFRVMLQRLPDHSKQKKRKSRVQMSVRNTILESQNETMQVRKNFKTVTSRLLTRAKARNTNKTYKCRMCEEIFDNLSNVRSHIKDLHPNEKMRNNVSLTISKSSIIETKYPCSVCSLSFSNRKKLYYHKQVHSQEPNCDVCGQKFKNKFTLKNHMEAHLNGPLKCDICDKTFNFRTSLYRHMKSVHRSKSSSKTHSNIFKKIYKCKICEESFGKLRLVRSHFRSKHPDDQSHQQESDNSFKEGTHPNVEMTYSCSVCNISYTNRSALRYHKLQHGSNKEFVCTVCGKTLKNKVTLSAHLQAHLDANSFKCNLCDQSFNLKIALKRHFVVAHTDERPFKCEICDQSFKLRQYLHKHNIRHRDNKAFVCEDCGQRFSTKTDLKIHRRLHTGDLLSCSKCDKKFTRNYDLKKHDRMVHIKEVSYVCHICGKSMKNNNNLTLHLRLHTGEKPFQCSVCNKPFLRKDYLDDHMKTHSKEMMKCQICGKSILNKSNFRKHMKIHNKNSQYNESDNLWS